MRHKLWAVLIVLGLMVWWLLSNKSQQPIESTVQNPVIENLSKEETLVESAISVADAKKQPSLAESVEDLIYQELSQIDLNEDPYLAALAIKGKINQCKIIDFDKKLSQRADYEKVKPLIHEYETQCQQWIDRYPTLSENLNQIDAISATTAEGKETKLTIQKRASGDYKYSSFEQLNNYQQSEKDFFSAQQAGDFAALRKASGGMFNHSLKLRRPEQDFLGGNFFYVRRMAGITLQLLSCEQGVSKGCEPASYLMMTTCLETPHACGLSYPQWAEKFLTPGMKMDVEALQAYYTANMED